MDINRLVQGVLGGGAGAASGTASQVKQVAERGLGGLAGALPGGALGGAAAGGLVAMLLGSKKARKLGGKAPTYGGLAVVGGLAYKAWRDHRASQEATQGPAPAPSAPTSGAPTSGAPTSGAPMSGPTASLPPEQAFDPATQVDVTGQDMRLGLIRAMISAAKADGHIDADEHAKLRQQIESSGLAADEKGFVLDAMGAESDPIAIASLAADEPQSVEIYVASALAIDIDTPEERRYMERLGDALRLPMDIRQRLEAEVAQAKASADADFA